MCRCLAVLLGLLFTAPASAQSVDSQLWLTASASGQIAPHVPVVVDTVYRISDAGDGPVEWSRGVLTGYRTDGGTDLLIGYQRVTGYADGKVARVENRLRQQIGFTLAKLPGITLTARVRADERFRSGENQMGVRLRPQLRAAVPLGPITLTASEEVFVELNDTRWGQRTGLRRLRTQLGIEAPVLPGLKGQVAYLNQYDFGAGGKRDAMANVLVVGLALGF